MNHARLIFEDTPAFVPVPLEMQHRKTEIIFLPLDDELSPESFATQQNLVVQNEVPEANKNSNLLLPDAFFESLEKIDKPRSLLELIGKVPPCFKSAAEVDAFIRAERDAWEDNITMPSQNRESSQLPASTDSTQTEWNNFFADFSRPIMDDAPLLREEIYLKMYDQSKCNKTI